MDYSFPPFTKKVEDALLFNGDGEFIFYVPENFFGRKDAVIMGEYVSIMGVFDYAVFDESGQSTGLKRFQFPTVFLTKPSEIEKHKNVKLTKTSETQDYRFLRYKKNDPIMISTRVPMDIDNLDIFYSTFFLTAKFPTTIPYNKLHEYITDSIELNGSSYGLSMQIFGVVISELCRDSSDFKKSFRLTKMNNMNEYTPINIKELPKYITPYSSLTSENWDDAIVGAITNADGPKSPMEKMLMT